MSGACPLCKQPVTAPSLDDVIAARRLNGDEEKILRAIWAGRGLPVRTNVIFDAMYQDDIDGGPSQSRMYAEFRRALEGLNSKLNTAGVAIHPVGYRDGHRLTLRKGK